MVSMPPISPDPPVRRRARGSPPADAAQAPLYGGRTAPHRLDILIVGCGLGGLAAAYCLMQAGHTVTIVESAPVIAEVGAGIQVSPNVSRLLIRWGLGPALAAVSVVPSCITFRSYKTGERVGRTDWSGMEATYGAPYYHIHRADLQKMLFALAIPRATLLLGSTVVSIDPAGPRPSVTLASGATHSADLVVGADGVKSLLRSVVVGAPDRPVPTGDAAYRAIVPAVRMRAHPELAPLVDYPEMTSWMGPGRHVMGYCVRAAEEYNIVLLHPDDGSVESWTAEGSADKMRADFAGWEPRIQKILGMVQSTLKWQLMDRAPLDTWIHPGGHVVLLGDACHPMLGAAMAIEDAAVLGALLARLADARALGLLLGAYAALRHARTARTQASSRLNQTIFHMRDGPAQQARDAAMRKAMQKAPDDREAAERAVARAAALADGASEAEPVEAGGERHLANGDVPEASGDAHAARADGVPWAEPLVGVEEGHLADGDVASGDAHAVGAAADDPVLGAAGAGNPNQWADEAKNREQFGYDADAAADAWWEDVGRHAVLRV